MKKLLAVLSLIIASVVAEPPASAPYAPSGWRPNGPNFDLPQRIGAQNSKQQDSYLPPLDSSPQSQYGPPQASEGDVSVQGLPAKEQVPLFVVSPVNGQQYVGSNFNDDIRSLGESYRQSQFQIQQQKFSQLARQREIDLTQNQQNNFGPNGPPNPQVPRQFSYRTTTYPTTPNEGSDVFKSTQPDTAPTVDALENDDKTKPLTANRGKQNEEDENVSVQVTRQNVQEISPEALLSAITQLNSQAQLTYPLQQLGQLRAPVFFQPNGVPLAQLTQSQTPVNEFNGPAHLAAIQSLLSQRQLVVEQPQGVLATKTQGQLEPNNYVMLVQQSPENPQQFNQYQPVFQQQPQVYNPQIPALVQNQPQYQYSQPQYQQPEYLQPNYNQPQTILNKDSENNKEDDINVISNQQVQYQQQFPVNQLQSYQPQEVQNYQLQLQYQPQAYQQNQPLNQPQRLNYQPATNQDLSQYYQNQAFLLQQQRQYTQPQQFANHPQVYQNQDALQSGLNVNQQGNGINPSDKDDDSDEDTKEEDNPNAVAVANAFGERTSPRVFSQYGVPRSNTEQKTATESMESSTEEGSTIAEANAMTRGEKRKAARLRNRRLRPLFSLDKSGHLVLVDQ